MELSKGQINVLRAKARSANEERYLEASRKRLASIVEKKIRTSFIGALAAFEEVFGDLWGAGLDESELTPDQKRLRDLWEDARTRVLNNGNTQLRAAINEISNHVVSWNRHYLELKVKTGE